MSGNAIKKTIKLAGAAALCMALATPVMAEETFSIAYNAAKKSALDVAMRTFIEDANTILAGKAKVVRFKGRKGGRSDKKVIKNLKKGKIDIGVVSTNMAKVRAPLAVFEMPWFVTNAIQAETILHGKEGLNKKLKRWSGRGGFRLLGTLTDGLKYLATFEQNFTKPSDLKGLWIETGNTGYLEKSLEKYGAKRGKSDGMIASLKTIAKKRESWERAPKYVSSEPIAFTPALILVSKKNKNWKTLKKLMPAAKNAEKLSAKLATAQDQKAWESIKDNSNITITKIDINAFRKATVPVYRYFETHVNGAFGTMNQVRSITGVDAGS